MLKLTEPTHMFSDGEFSFWVIDLIAYDATVRVRVDETPNTVAYKKGYIPHDGIRKATDDEIVEWINANPQHHSAVALLGLYQGGEYQIV